MSGYNVPYQLRTNKFVERSLFLDLLDFVRVWNGPSKYLYASMGGRFLEDFKMINDRLAIEQMIAIEMDTTTSKRQEFNRPLGFIECRNQSSGEFIVDFDRLVADHREENFVVWLDYAVANKRDEQLQECRELVPKLASGDVVKITLNANYQSYRKRSNFGFHKDFQSTVIDNMEEQLGEFMPIGGMTADHFKPDKFSQLLCGAVKTAVQKGCQGSDLHAVPLAAFRYRDGEHQMLTVTIILSDDGLKKKIEDDKVFQEWECRASSWDDVHEVNVPDLSQKERYFINELISSASDQTSIHHQIPFRLDENEKKSLALLKNYLQHYRRYPTFSRVQF